MMLVFEMGGTVDHIRQVWGEYRKENNRPIDAPNPTSNFGPQGPVKQLDLAIYTAMWAAEGTELRPLQHAKRKTWKRAEDQEIVGYGEPLAGGAPTAIQHFHWPALTLSDDYTGLVLRFGDGSGYRHVRFANPRRNRESPSERQPFVHPQASPSRKRGPRPSKRERIVSQMLADLESGVYSAQELFNEKEDALSIQHD